MSVNHATHLLFIFQFSGSVSLIHRLIVDFISGSASAKRSSSSWTDCLNLLTDVLTCCFRDDLIVVSSYDFSAEAPEEVGCCSLDENLGLMMRADFLFLNLACMEEIDPIYFIFGISIMFTILKGMETFPGLIFHRSICNVLVV